MKLEKNTSVPFQVMNTVAREDLKEYAEVSGDYNKIHLDENVAQAVGLPGVIAHGMLIAGYMAERGRNFILDCALQGLLEGDWRIQIIQNRFRGMTFPGEEISVGGSIREILLEGDDRRIVLDLVARNHSGDIKTTAIMRFTLV